MGDCIIIGVDGGGSGCRVAVGTVARGVLARAAGGPANVSSDLRGAVGNVLFAVQAAAYEAGFDVEDLAGAVAHLGLAGVMGQQEADAVARALPFAASTVTDDRPTTARGALGGADGYIAALGTGSFVGRMEGGIFHGVGGWGLVLSDQASGGWLGRMALCQALLAHDGVGPRSGLTADLLAGFAGPTDIVQFAAEATPAHFARFAPQVVQAAAGGDAVAVDLMTQGAGYVHDALSALGYADGDTLCLTGGVGPHYAPFLPAVVQSGIKPAKGSALDGAFALARAAAG